MALLWFVGGCGGSDREGNGLSFRNGTTATLTITYLTATGEAADEPIVHSLRPGEVIAAHERFLVNDCHDVTLVANDPNGVEVARRSGVICAPGEWVIE